MGGTIISRAGPSRRAPGKCSWADHPCTVRRSRAHLLRQLQLEQSMIRVGNMKLQLDSAQLFWSSLESHYEYALILRIFMKNKLSLRTSLCIGFVIAISIAGWAQQAQTEIAPGVEQLRAHIEYLTSDKFDGRRTGSPGANLAAEYIARDFSRYRLRRSIGRD